MLLFSILQCYVFYGTGDGFQALSFGKAKGRDVNNDEHKPVLFLIFNLISQLSLLDL